MGKKFNGLPEWALRAGGRVLFGEHPLSETMGRLGSKRCSGPTFLLDP